LLPKTPKPLINIGVINLSRLLIWFVNLLTSKIEIKIVNI